MTAHTPNESHLVAPQPPGEVAMAGDAEEGHKRKGRRRSTLRHFGPSSLKKLKKDFFSLADSRRSLSKSFRSSVTKGDKQDPLPFSDGAPGDPVEDPKTSRRRSTMRHFSPSSLVKLKNDFFSLPDSRRSVLSKSNHKSMPMTTSTAMGEQDDPEPLRRNTYPQTKKERRTLKQRFGPKRSLILKLKNGFFRSSRHPEEEVTTDPTSTSRA
ncbi:expressed unknown protein [Seminavis robusta]|uniref:Uncharacterized protein n=1 Tax=Seminavis robusta TaxID=568900 RepID=A0A9N8EG65_9STRA|nr:expressed unknown protein [Seminavis robusta]|eukprot:Sro897_g217490.1 n/a (211) ;mRNA; f:21835-22467